MSNPRNFKRINYALAATLLTSGATFDSIAPQVGAKNANSLKVGLARRGVTAKRCRAMPFNQEVPQSLALRVANDAGQVLKEMMGSSTLKAAESLSKAKPGRSVKQIKAYADALEPLSRVGDRLYGWSGAQSGSVFGVVLLEDKAEKTPQHIDACGTDKPVIEVESTQEPPPSTT